MSNKQSFKHRGYEGSIETSVEDECLFGKILFVRDLILYHGSTIPELKAAFIEAVDQYLEDCEELGKSPDKPCTGSFNVRIGTDRHKTLSAMSWHSDTSINKLVEEAVDLLIAKKNGHGDTHVSFNFSITQELNRDKEGLSWNSGVDAPRLKVVK